MDLAFIEYLSAYVSERRLVLFKKILQLRTRYLTVVLEDIYQSHNASAVLRSCDSFGIQDVHVIENKNTFELSTNVTIGSDKWLSIINYSSEKQSTLFTFNKLREQGYRIVATTPHNRSVTLNDFDLTRGKCAFVFGTELEGLSSEALKNADEFLYIPMVGFSESLNISVSAAIILNTLSHKLRNLDINWHLSKEEQIVLLENWLLKTLKNPELYVERYRALKHSFDK
jgi:tRNA (guanosine-2'-O-)-methyltransferase